MIDQKLSHPTVVLSSRLVLLYVKTSKKVGSERFGKSCDDAVHDPLDLALSPSSGHTAPTKIPATLQMAPLPVYHAPYGPRKSLYLMGWI